MVKEKTLVEADKYLKTGAHIGTKFKSGDMRRYIYKMRKDGLNVLDVQNLVERIKIVADFLALFEPEKIVVVARRLYGHTPVKMFAESIGARAFTGRFVPGTFTNPKGKEFVEPGILIATEPEPDLQAINEATKMNIPVVALCSTNNSTRNVDLILPVNNKGRKSLALVYWLLAREFLEAKGTIKTDKEFNKKLEDFEYQIKEGKEAEERGGEEVRRRAIIRGKKTRGRRRKR